VWGPKRLTQHFGAKPEGKEQLDKNGHRGADNIKIIFKEICGCRGH
jgi:hypothetical protein